MNYFKLEGVAVRLVKDRPLYSREKLDEPEKVVALLGNEMQDLDREEVRVIFFDSKMQPIAWHQLSIGALDRSIVSPRELLKAAILTNASSIILMHNHPSGDVTPSESDNLLTSRLSKICALIDIPLLEHIIVGSYGDFYSYSEHKEIPNATMSSLGITVIPDEIDLPGLPLVAEG